LILFFLSI